MSDNASECVVGTLPQWIYSRLSRQGLVEGRFEDLSEDDQAFWIHEAHAYKRAAQRNGFKAPQDA